MGLYEAKEALERKTDEFTDLVDEDITHITSDEVSLNLGDGTARRSIQYIFRSNG